MSNPPTPWTETSLAAAIKQEICDRHAVDPRQIDIQVKLNRSHQCWEIAARMPMFGGNGEISVADYQIFLGVEILEEMNRLTAIRVTAFRIANDLGLRRLSPWLNDPPRVEASPLIPGRVQDSEESGGAEARHNRQAFITDRMRQLIHHHFGGHPSIPDRVEVSEGRFAEVRCFNDEQSLAARGSCGSCAYYMAAPFNACNALHNLPSEGDRFKVQNCADWEAR